MLIPAEAGPIMTGGGLTALAGAIYALARAIAPAGRAVVAWCARQDAQQARMVKALDRINERLEMVERAIVQSQTISLPPRVQAVKP